MRVLPGDGGSAPGFEDLVIVIDTRERYPYRLSGTRATTERRALPAGDYGVALGGEIVGVVEREPGRDPGHPPDPQPGRAHLLRRDPPAAGAVDLPLPRTGPGVRHCGGGARRLTQRPEAQPTFGESLQIS